MAPQKRMFKPLRLKLSDVDDAEARSKIEDQFEKFNFLRSQANEKMRLAAISDAESVIGQQETRVAFIKLLLSAGEYLDPIKIEQTWAAFRKDGDIVFECPFSELDMRNAMKVQRATMEQQAKNIEGDGLYEPDENEEPEQ